LALSGPRISDCTVKRRTLKWQSFLKNKEIYIISYSTKKEHKHISYIWISLCHRILLEMTVKEFFNTSGSKFGERTGQRAIRVVHYWDGL
jgi:hypothetical protein